MTASLSIDSLDALVSSALGISSMPSAAGTIDQLEPLDTLGYIRRMFEPGDWINLQFIHSTEKYPGTNKSKINNNFMLVKDVNKTTMKFIRGMQDRGWNSYIAMNAFTPGIHRRRKIDVKNVRTVYIEDRINLPRLANDINAGIVPAPDFVLRSSPEKYYVIWMMRDTTVQQAEALNSTLQKLYGGDPASTDASRVFRLPGTLNLKYETRPYVEIVKQKEFAASPRRYCPDDFKIPYTVTSHIDHTADPEAQQIRASCYEQACEDAKLDAGEYTDKETPEGMAYRYEIGCPNFDQHGDGLENGASVIIFPSGRIAFGCWHSHCKELNWVNFYRPWMEEQAKQSGHRAFLKFGEPGEVPRGSESSAEVPCGSERPEASNQRTVHGPTLPITPEVQALLEEPDEKSESSIPPFDRSVINGIFSKFVELITRGTTLEPQFAYVIAKTIVGIKMAGKVKFETIDVEPRLYVALIAATGGGKGEAYRRARSVLQPEGAMINAHIKIINSADSGAGLKEFFFSPPENEPVLCFVDEIEDLGNKASTTRNPGILDTMITLADDTSITRSLAKGTRTKDDARLCMIMCGQDGLTYTKALAGRTKLGLWDRFYPEYGVPQETGDMPPIALTDAINLLQELNRLEYCGTMKMCPEAKTAIDTFWRAQPAEVRKKARWKKNLQLDAYLSAFGRGVKIVDLDDVAIAIKIFTRQVVIRKVCFTTEVPDRIGYYVGLIKRITARMEAQLKKGVHPDFVAKSQRDYQKETHAHRDNEPHIFERAWRVYEPVWLKTHRVKKANGQIYTKFLPADED